MFFFFFLRIVFIKITVKLCECISFGKTIVVIENYCFTVSKHNDLIIIVRLNYVYMVQVIDGKLL